MARASKRTKATHRRLASWILADLYRIALVKRDSGDILDAGQWLRVLANILSAAPPGADGSRRGKTAPQTFGLNPASLTLAAARCGINASPDGIASQVAETTEWRAAESARIGRPHHAPMTADTIGKALGVTDECRREAKAWRIGTIDGSPEQRAAAYRQREADRKRAERATKGAVPRVAYVGKSLSQAKPWEAEGVSRRTWYRRLSSAATAINCENGTSPSANNKAASRGTSPSGTSPSAHNKDRGTSPSAHNKGNRPCAGSRSRLPAIATPKNAVAKVKDPGASLQGDAPRKASSHASRAPKDSAKRHARLAPHEIDPNGLAARALRLVQAPILTTGRAPKARRPRTATSGAAE